MSSVNEDQDAAAEGLVLAQLKPRQWEYEATVVGCEPWKFDKKKSEHKVLKKKMEDCWKGTRFAGAKPGWMVRFDDTVLFPEGGGQPSDFGTAGGVQLMWCGRVDGVVVHLADGPLEEGSVVQMAVDVERRVDHTQQHSAQHLLSAVCRELQGWETTSWNLGTNECDVELDVKEVSEEALAEVETRVNAVIAEARSVQAIVEEGGEGETGKANMHGAYRHVVIEGVDDCACCGTHVETTGALLALKILGWEKARGGVRVFFVAGQRVLKRMQAMLDREAALRAMLSTSNENIVELVGKAQQSARDEAKKAKALAAELAQSLAAGYDVESGEPVFLNRPGASMEFLKEFAWAVRARGDVCVLGISDEQAGGGKGKGKGGSGGGGPSGVYVMAGPQEKLTRDVAKALAELIGGKGGGAQGMFQGKLMGEVDGEMVEKVLSGMGEL